MLLAANLHRSFEGKTQRDQGLRAIVQAEMLEKDGRQAQAGWKKARAAYGLLNHYSGDFTAPVGEPPGTE